MTLREQNCFNELADDIVAFTKGKKVVEIVNSGNWGDALIHAGTEEFLRDHDIDFEPVSIHKLKKKKELKDKLTNLFTKRRAILTGCGAFRKFYTRPAEIAAASGRFSQVIILPSSYPFDLNLLPSNVTLWRRDKLESMNGAAEAKFCHDLAFYLDPSPRKPKKNVGFFFRTDVERSEYLLPENNTDLSAEGTHKSDPEVFFDRVGEFEVIHTNRLHVGVAGALLGREVHLYPNNNLKVKSIFECSLRPFYEYVFYHDDVTETNVLRLPPRS